MPHSIFKDARNNDRYLVIVSHGRSLFISLYADRLVCKNLINVLPSSDRSKVVSMNPAFSQLLPI